MSKFNPSEHKREIKGNAYLDVKWRVMWFREDHPNGAIITNLVEVGGMVAVRAEIYTAEGGLLASGMSTARDQPGQTWTGRVIEKAETSAIGRALAHCGYGTQFMDNDGDDLADSPVEKTAKNAPTQRANQPQDRQAASNPKTPPTPSNGANTGKPDNVQKTDAIESFVVKLNDDGLRYMVAGGVTFFSCELFRDAGFNMHMNEIPPGAYDFKAPVVVHYKLDDKGYKQSVKVERI